MHRPVARFLSSWVLVGIAAIVAIPAFGQVPHLRKQGDATQLIIDGKPFLILGGELGNSTASSLEYLEPHWPRLVQLNLNTVLATVSWELIEPVEGQFDFASVDGLIRGARAHNLRLVLLWFGSWKNSMSSYVPAWVKRNQERFPRAQLPNGDGVEILSPLSASNRDADARAFKALMAHLKAVDGTRNTVIMVQVENEVGMLPVAREHGAEANRQFAAPVPQELVDYLVRNRATLIPSLRQQWERYGAKTSGNWQTLFGGGPATDEIFTAWSLARFVEAVTAAGKSAYPLPMFVNAALNRPGRLPGEYPSGGPLPHLVDIWKAAAPSVDFLSPDIYFPNFGELIAKYDLSGNPLFIPEANRAGQPEAGANAFYAIGQHKAMGFSPFSIESIPDPAKDPLSGAYAVLRELAPTILANQGLGRMVGMRPPVSFEGVVNDTTQTVTLGDYRFTVMFIDQWTPKEEQQTAAHGGMIIQTGPEEYLVAGRGFALEFAALGPDTHIAGIDSAWEGRFVNGRWQPGRLLNGDETHQGRRVKMPLDRFSIQRLKLYRYR
jgi:beta-galactosidase GanA